MARLGFYLQGATVPWAADNHPWWMYVRVCLLMSFLTVGSAVLDTLHTLRFGLNAVYVDPWAQKMAKRGRTLTWECSKLGHKSSCAILEVVFPVVYYFKVVNLWL